MERLKVAICENEPIQAEYLQKLLVEYANMRKLEIIVNRYESAEAFLFAYEDQKNVDLLILDIQMNEMTGIDLATKLREKKENVKVIFTTGMTEYMGMGYRLEATDYLLKPINPELLFAALDRVLQSRPVEKRAIILPLKGEQMKVFEADICAVEVSGKELTIHLATESLTLKMTMQEFKNRITEMDFVPTDRSWLVHLAHIERITKTDVILDNGILAPLSRRNQRNVTEAFIQYHRR